jgi:hypothetical protein
MLDWRKIESALCKVIHDNGYSIIANHEAGDNFALGMVAVHDDGADLNLTELAKDLAQELSHD